MEYRVYGNDVVLRIQKGEEILTCLKEVCEKEHITSALSPDWALWAK